MGYKKRIPKTFKQFKQYTNSLLLSTPLHLFQYFYLFYLSFSHSYRQFAYTFASFSPNLTTLKQKLFINNKKPSRLFVLFRIRKDALNPFQMLHKNGKISLLQNTFYTKNNCLEGNYYLLSIIFYLFNFFKSYV